MNVFMKGSSEKMHLNVGFFAELVRVALDLSLFSFCVRSATGFFEGKFSLSDLFNYHPWVMSCPNRSCIQMVRPGQAVSYFMLATSWTQFLDNLW